MVVSPRPVGEHFYAALLYWYLLNFVGEILFLLEQTSVYIYIYIC